MRAVETAVEEIREREVSLVDLAAAVARRKWLVAWSAALAMAVTAGVVFLIPASYTAEAVVMPPQPEPSAQSMMMSPLSGLGALGAGSLAQGLLRNPLEMYIGLLKSRTIADALIAKFRLQELYQKSTLVKTRKALALHTSITTGKDMLLRIEFEDHDPVRAAAVANEYVNELQAQNSRLAIGTASQRRKFFEERLAGEKGALAEAETALKKSQQTSGLVFPPGQSEALIRSVAQLRAAIASREVELESMRLYATNENPQVQMVERELAGERAQLEKLEAGAGNGGLAVSARALPEAGMEFLRKTRDLKYHEVLFELLSRQYEAARIDEAKMAPGIQVVDTALPPDQKSWPPRALLIIGSGLLAAIGAALAALVKRHD